MTTKLTKYKIIYRFPEDLNLDDPIDENDRIRIHLVDLANELEKDTNVKLVYILVINNKRLVSIFVEYIKRVSLHQIKKILIKSNFDMDLIDIRNVDGRVKDYIDSFFKVAYYADETLYMYHKDILDIEEYAKKLA
jgi:hypothetical protein